MKTELTHRIRAILHDRRTRRTAMFWLTLLLMVLVFLGSTVMAASLADEPVVFLVFWGGVLFLAVGLFIFGLYDLLRVRQEIRAEPSDSDDG